MENRAYTRYFNSENSVIRIIRTIIFLFLATAYPCVAEESSSMNKQIDQRSFTLGGLSTFAEMVSVGVKTLALSAAVTPEEMDVLADDAAGIAREEGVMLYRETDLIVTDLFPADVAVGKHVLLIYKGTTLEEYLALKERKADLVEARSYAGEARRDIARQFGKLLSYPDTVIEELINKNFGSTQRQK